MGKVTARNCQTGYRVQKQKTKHKKPKEIISDKLGLDFLKFPS